MYPRLSARHTDDIDNLILLLQESIYLKVIPLSITCWRSREPLPFADRFLGTVATVTVGERWAEEVFECAWMRFSAVVPAGCEVSRLVARIDVNGELCVVDAAGIPTRGLTCVKSSFDPRLGGPGKSTYRVPVEAVNDGVVELWADAAFNDLFGAVCGGGVVSIAELTYVREDIRQLYYDLETLRDFRLCLKDDDVVAVKLDTDFDAARGALNTFSAQNIEAVRERLRPWFNSSDKPSLQIHAVGHAHLDLAWLWPVRETIRKGARTFASALYNSTLYPGFTLGFSQPQLFAWMKKAYPELYCQLKQAVRDGVIEPQGRFWVEPDCSMPNGESYVRQILYGAQFFKEEFGVVPDYCWQPDVFGYHGQLPQILHESGHRYFMTQKLSWNVVNRFPHHSFWWEGINGTRILVHMLPEETYNSPAAARSLIKIGGEYAQHDISDHALMAYGIGDGGGGPDAEHFERLKRVGGLPGVPAVRPSSSKDFFEVWEKQAHAFPVWKGELYLERHQGTLTTQGLVKRNNRLAEVALRECEWAAFLGSVLVNVPYPADDLRQLWKEVLLYQFHDILPGSSIRRVYDECNSRYSEILEKLEELTIGCYRRVAEAYRKDDLPMVFNSLSWDRSERLKIDGTWYHARVPALGWCSVGEVDSGQFQGLNASASCLENERLLVAFDEGGRVASLWDKHHQREVLLKGQLANDLVIIADRGDAWDFETDHPDKDVWCYLRLPVERPVLKDCAWNIDGPRAELHQTWQYNKSTIRQTVSLSAGASLLEFTTEVDWQEAGRMLRVRFPVAVEAEAARFEIPFGYICRSTREDTSIERAQIEVPALQWVDLSNEGGGVALYNDCKYGFRLKGSTIDMALIRSVPHPGSALVGKDDVSTPQGGSYTDLTLHNIRYALRPHGGGVSTPQLVAEARAFNTPLRVIAACPERLQQTRIRQAPVIKVLNPAIEVAGLKQTEDADGWAIRLVNVTDAPVTTDIEIRLTFSRCEETDLMETVIRQLQAVGGKLNLGFARFEIKTLVLR